MRICMFEDQASYTLAPLTLTRPAFDLWCGAYTFGDRLKQLLKPAEMGALVRPSLAEMCRHLHPEAQVNEPNWLLAGDTTMVNARWLPGPGSRLDFSSPRVGMVGDQVAYAVLPSSRLRGCQSDTVDDSLEEWKQSLPPYDAGGWMINYPWDLVERIGESMELDFQLFTSHGERKGATCELPVVGPREQAFIHPGAQVEPFVVLDTRQGPVMIDHQAVVQAFTRIEGPCYIGRGTTVLGGRITGSTIGPACKVAGEIDTSIIHANSNKAHTGFVGHSYIGEWVNLGAGTHFSDLRNDYATVHVTVAGERINSGCMKVGSFVGDHCKTGLNTLLNTGTMVGAFCNLLPTGWLLPKVIPSFSTFWNAQLREESDIEVLLAVASTMMRRRGTEMTPTHASFYQSLHDWTAVQRHQVIRESHLRRLRRRA